MGLGGLTSVWRLQGGVGRSYFCLETTHRVGLGGLTFCLETTGWGVGGLTSCLETTGFALARVVAGDLGVGGEDKVGIVTGGVEIGSIQAFGRLKVSQFVGREFVGSSSES